MKLKTLKDLEEEFKKDVTKAASSGDFAVNTMLVGANLFYFTRGKEEAIKWVKAFDTEEIELGGMQVNSEGDCRVLFKEWIKHFFSIEDEDLK